MPKSNDSQTSKPLISTTLRISNEQHVFIEELMKQMDMSKQRVMTFLLEEGVKAVKENIRIDQKNYFSESSYYLFNLSENVNDKAMMLDKQRIASKDVTWKSFIEKVNTKSTVFLYSEKKGIIAYGSTSGKHSTMQGYTYQELLNFQNLDYPVPVDELKKLLGLNMISSKVIIPLPEGDKILNFINTACHICPNCGITAKGLNEIHKTFGVRKTSKGVTHQSWCRVCRRRK